MWFLFLSAHLVGLVGYNILLRKSLVAKVDKWTLATIMQSAIALPMIFALFIATPDFASYTIQNWILIVSTAIFVIGLHTTNVFALQHLEAGVYSILYNLRIIITTILGIAFLDESIVPLQILGGLLIFAAVIAVKQKGDRRLTTIGIRYGVLAAFVISFLNLFEKKLIADIGFLGYAIPVMLISSILMWGVFIVKGNKISVDYLKQPKTIQLMLFRALSAYGFTLAFYNGAVLSVSSYISSLSVIIIVLLGIFILKENDYLKQKLIATGLAALGLTAILIANLQ
jgi:drug/metabolite transporter (DMT)-like permease